LKLSTVLLVFVLSGGALAAENQRRPVINTDSIAVTIHDWEPSGSSELSEVHNSISVRRKVGLMGFWGGPMPITATIQQSTPYRLPQSGDASAFAHHRLSLEMLFEDPMGNGGINSPCNTAVGYVDLDPGAGILDYMCGQITYDGHTGYDIMIRDFYEMDEGVAILAAAEGFVTYSHDGEFDRHVAALPDAVSNLVVVQHADGSEVLYHHLKKNSVCVAPGDYVYAGDTLGMVGSSGYSSSPHLHFMLYDPYPDVVCLSEGPCNPGHSLWGDQSDYVLNLPVQLITSGIATSLVQWSTVLERPPSHTHVTAPAVIYPWMMVRSALDTTAFLFRLFANDHLWDEGGFSPGVSSPVSWWYAGWSLPADPGLYGDWRVEVYAAGELMVERTFVYDDIPNRSPELSDSTLIADEHGLSGEFIATDDDGSIFWYDVIELPLQGELIQDGGRRRRFTYYPDIDYTNDQTARLQAIDDDSAASPIAAYTFRLGAAFTADTTLGWAPLPVQFTGISGLQVDSWSWTFGDSDSSSEGAPLHIYASGGAYDVGLEITSGATIRTTSKADYIVILADTLRGQDTEGSPGEQIEVSIAARNSIPVSQLVIPIEWNGDLNLTFDSLSTSGCRTEYFERQVITALDEASKRLTIELEASPIHSSPDLPPGDGPALNVFLTLASGAQVSDTTTIQFDGYSTYQPTWISALTTYTPALHPGTISVAETSCCEHRGDVDHNGTEVPDIADLVYMVTYMFQDGPPPPCDEPYEPNCPDHRYSETDVDGNGTCFPDIADLVYMVTYMFQDGPALVPCP